MILFQLDWATEADSGSYLTVGNDTDTEEMIKGDNDDESCEEV